MPDSSNYKILRYKLGNVLRTINSPWLQKKFEIDNISNIFASSFGSTGWHPIIKTLEEYDLNSTISVDETSLWKYHKNFLPKSTSTLINKKINASLPTFIYPWGSFNDGSSISKKKQKLSRFCGPSSDQFIQDEFIRTIALYESLKISGYTPKKYPHSYIGGTILEKNNGQKKFIVMQGNHRTAIFAHLGYKNLDVRLIKNALNYVREKDLSKWTMVNKGQCNESDAKKIFDFFFEEDGHHILNILNQK